MPLNPGATHYEHAFLYGRTGATCQRGRRGGLRAQGSSCDVVTQAFFRQHRTKWLIFPGRKTWATRELEGQTIIELRRDGAAGIKGWAELYAPGGVLVKAVDSGIFALDHDKTPMKIGTIVISGNRIVNARIGVHITRTGFTIGAS